MATYEIGTGNAITIDFGDSQIVQPTWPDGTKWKSKTEAEAWAKLFVAHLADDSAPRPGNGPDKKVLEIADLELSEAERAALDEARAAEEAAKEEQAAAEAAAIQVLEESLRGTTPTEPDEDIVDAEEVTE